MNTSYPSGRRPGQRFEPRAAFTLIELLVVISIIAVLVAMLTPTISLVRDSSRSAVCMSNLRQVSLAYLTYVNDNDNNLPNHHAGANANHFDPALMDTYLPSTSKAWYCAAPWFRKNSWTFVSNWWMNSTPAGTSPVEQLYGKGKQMIAMAMVVRPSEAWLAADLDGQNIGDYHRGYANMCFIDGHTKHRIDRSRSMNVVAWVNIDPSDSLKAEYMYSKGPAAPSTLNRLKGFNYTTE